MLPRSAAWCTKLTVLCADLQLYNELCKIAATQYQQVFL